MTELTFKWPAISHPHFDGFAWSLWRSGRSEPVQQGSTDAAHVRVYVPSNLPATYHVTVEWRHAKSGKWTYHAATETQTVAEPVPEPLTEPASVDMPTGWGAS